MNETFTYPKLVFTISKPKITFVLYQSQIREQMSGADLHVFALKFIALKTLGFHFFGVKKMYYATFQCRHTSQNSFNKWTKISSLKIIIFELKMMVKSGLEFILKFTQPLQRYLLSCQANSAILCRYFCTGKQQL